VSWRKGEDKSGGGEDNRNAAACGDRGAGGGYGPREPAGGSNGGDTLGRGAESECGDGYPRCVPDPSRAAVRIPQAGDCGNGNRDASAGRAIGGVAGSGMPTSGDDVDLGGAACIGGGCGEGTIGLARTEQIVLSVWLLSLFVVALVLFAPVPAWPGMAGVFSAWRVDFVMHVLLFAWLMAVPHASVWGRRRRVRLSMELTVVAFGLEVAPVLAGLRTMDLSHVTANLAGILVGAGIGLQWSKRIGGRSRAPKSNRSHFTVPNREDSGTQFKG